MRNKSRETRITDIALKDKYFRTLMPKLEGRVEGKRYKPDHF